jgi:hypothetical protein
MPLEPGNSPQVCGEPPMMASSATDLIRPNIVHYSLSDPVAAAEHSPPDLLVLNATFLI